MRRTRTRPALLIAATAGTAVVLAGCSASSDAALDPDADLSTQTLTVTTWPEYYPPTLAEDFEKATGVHVEILHHATNEEGLAKVTTSADTGIDVAFLSGGPVSVLIEEGLVSPLDHSALPNLANLYPEASEFAFDPGLVYSAPYAWGTTGICYRSDLVSGTPTSWADILTPAPEHVGRITMLDDLRWMFLPAQKLLGYSLNTTDDDELADVEKVLSAASRNLLAFDNTTYGDKLAAGEATLSEAFDGWCNVAAQSDPRIAFALPEEGSDLWVDSAVILSSSQNKEAAHAFIDYVLSTDVSTWITENLLYNTPNEKAMTQLPSDLFATYTALTADGARLASMEQIVDLGADVEKYNLISTRVRADQ